MRFSAIFVLLTLLMASCGKHDKTSQQIIGTWHRDSRFSMTLSAGGDFLSSFLDTNQIVVLIYQGTWRVREGVLMLTITDVSGTLKHETNGSIDRLRIVELDSRHLALDGGYMTNYFERK
jgi:hypothetical protein